MFNRRRADGDRFGMTTEQMGKGPFRGLAAAMLALLFLVSANAVWGQTRTTDCSPYITDKGVFVRCDDISESSCLRCMEESEGLYEVDNAPGYGYSLDECEGEELTIDTREDELVYDTNQITELATTMGLSDQERLIVLFALARLVEVRPASEEYVRKIAERMASGGVFDTLRLLFEERK